MDNSDIAYKGLKYVIVWILIFFVVKYTSSSMSDVDTALAATAFTLLLCILDNMMSNTPQRHEINEIKNNHYREPFRTNRPNQFEHMSTQMDANKDSLLITGHNISMTSDGKNIIVADDSSVPESSISSSSSSSSSETPFSHLVKNGIDVPKEFKDKPQVVKMSQKYDFLVNDNDTVDPVTLDSNDSSKEDLYLNNTDADDVDQTRIVEHDFPNRSSQPLVYDTYTDSYRNYTVPWTTVVPKDAVNNSYYTTRNYLGDKVVFDRDEFGGTAIRGVDGLDPDVNSNSNSDSSSDSNERPADDLKPRDVANKDPVNYDVRILNGQNPNPNRCTDNIGAPNKCSGNVSLSNKPYNETNMQNRNMPNNVRPVGAFAPNVRAQARPVEAKASNDWALAQPVGAFAPNDRVLARPIKIDVPFQGSGKVFVDPSKAIADFVDPLDRSNDPPESEVKTYYDSPNRTDLLDRPSKTDNNGNYINNNNRGIDNQSGKKNQNRNRRVLKWYEQAFDPRSYEGAENLDQIAVGDGLTRNDMLVNQMIYSDFNRLPPSFVERDFEYGYSFLPPKDWYPLPVYPPVCVSNDPCHVTPVYVDNTTMDLKEWHATQKVTPPDSINTAFITNELNSKV